MNIPTYLTGVKQRWSELTFSAKIVGVLLAPIVLPIFLILFILFIIGQAVGILADVFIP